MGRPPRPDGRDCTDGESNYRALLSCDFPGFYRRAIVAALNSDIGVRRPLTSENRNFCRTLLHREHDIVLGCSTLLSSLTKLQRHALGRFPIESDSNQSPYGFLLLSVDHGGETRIRWISNPETHAQSSELASNHVQSTEPLEATSSGDLLTVVLAAAVMGVQLTYWKVYLSDYAHNGVVYLSRLGRNW